MDEDERTASCACEALRARFSGEPFRVHACCCLACQKRTGSAFSYTAFFREDQLVAFSGPSRAFIRTAESGGSHQSVFCPDCGACVLVRLGVWPGVVGAPVGAFSDSGFAAPAVIYWTSQSQCWLWNAAAIEAHETQ